MDGIPSLVLPVLFLLGSGSRRPLSAYFFGLNQSEFSTRTRLCDTIPFRTFKGENANRSRLTKESSETYQVQKSRTPKWSDFFACLHK